MVMGAAQLHLRELSCHSVGPGPALAKIETYANNSSSFGLVVERHAKWRPRQARRSLNGPIWAYYARHRRVERRLGEHCQAWAKRYSALDVVRTLFANEEMEAAAWAELVPEWHCGYPQPKPDEFGYREATYDMRAYCKECGMGLRQKAPFQMKGEPKWSRGDLLRNSTGFRMKCFVTPEVAAEFFEPAGVSSRIVQNVRGETLKSVVQLVVSAEENVATDKLVAHTCASCHRTRYLPTVRGRFPALSARPTANAVRTAQYFGSGATAHQRILVSQKIVRQLLAKKVSGVSFRPVEEVGGQANHEM